MTTETTLSAPFDFDYLTPGKRAMVSFVKGHAAAYLDAGWDVVASATSDAELAAAVGRARTTTGAVNAVRSLIVIPWVRGLVERGGTGDELVTARRLQDELTENWADVTARLEGRGNARRPPRRVTEELPVLPSPTVIEIDLSAAAGDRPAARRPRRSSKIAG